MDKVQKLHDFKSAYVVCKDIPFRSKRFIWLHLWLFHLKLNLIVRIVHCCFHYSSNLNSRRSNVRWPYGQTSLENRMNYIWSWLFYCNSVGVRWWPQWQNIPLLSSWFWKYYAVMLWTWAAWAVAWYWKHICAIIPQTWAACAIALYWKDLYAVML
jgi:hypothetical protein